MRTIHSHFMEYQRLLCSSFIKRRAIWHMQSHTVCASQTIIERLTFSFCYAVFFSVCVPSHFLDFSPQIGEDAEELSFTHKVLSLLQMIDYCELAVYQRGTFFTWVVYPRRLLVATRFTERPRLFILGLSETNGLHCVTRAVDEAASSAVQGVALIAARDYQSIFPAFSFFSRSHIHQRTVAFVTRARQGIVLPCL